MIQVYTGTGKGKTTAALGLCLRAAGAGLKVFVGQFLKKGAYSELRALKKIPGVTVEQYGTGRFIKREPAPPEVEAAQRGLRRAKRMVSSGKFDIVILDEFNVALRLGLFGCSDALDLISSVPKDVELVLTGRDADKTILKCADLVSEVVEVKHYFRRGTRARRGIEF